MNNGIQPTVELATNNGNGFGYPYPVYPMYGSNGNDGFFGGDGIWAIILLALLFGNGGWGGFGGFGGGFGGMYEFPWLLNGQQEINSNTNNGFNSLHLSNQIEGVRDGVASLSNQLCNVGNDITSAINTTAYNAEISANNRQMTNMNQIFGLSTQVANASADNRLASCQTQNTIISEAASTRFADANNTRDIIDSNNRNSQAILDKLCQLELDGFKRENEQLRSQLQFANMQASQVEQTAQLRASQATTANQLVSELRSCPIPAQPVYGNQPIFTYQPNYGCGCNGNF